MLAEQPLAARVDLMGRAAALLNPITWPEPFGLVMAEALATATPVLAFRHGAAPEIIDHGRTGYLCRDEDEMTAAVARVHQISRRQCRTAAERRFSLARMAADYERLYRGHPGTPRTAGARAGGNGRTVTAPAPFGGTAATRAARGSGKAADPVGTDGIGPWS